MTTLQYNWKVQQVLNTVEDESKSEYFQLCDLIVVIIAREGIFPKVAPPLLK